MNQVTPAETTDSAWKGLYVVGGAAALIAAVVFRRNWSAEFSLLRSLGILQTGPVVAPSAVNDWFDLLQSNPFIGLILLDLFDLVNYALVGLIYLALYGALRHVNKGAMVMATAFGLVGMAVYFASNQALAMLALSNQHAAATTDPERNMVLAAGQALLAINNLGAVYQGTGATLSLFLVTLAGLIISVVMLESSVFGKATAYVGLLAHLFGLGYFLALAFAPAILALPPSISAVFLLIWYILIGLRLLKLAQRS